MNRLLNYEEFFEAKANMKDMNPNEEYFSRIKSDKWPNRAAQEKLVAKVRQYTKEAEKEYNLKVTPDSKEQDILNIYVSKEYIKINSELRSGKISQKTQKIVDKIDKIINDYKLEQDIIAYRSVETSAIHSQDDAFKSITLSPFIALSFKKNQKGNSEIFKLKIPKGTNYAYIGGGEAELLLPRDFSLKKCIIE
jgi:hypothetical protein